MLGQLIRFFVILSYLSPHSLVSAGELARSTGLSPALVRRDFELLLELPIGLYEVDRGRFRVSARGYRTILSLLEGHFPRRLFVRLAP